MSVARGVVTVADYLKRLKEVSTNKVDNFSNLFINNLEIPEQDYIYFINIYRVGLKETEGGGVDDFVALLQSYLQVAGSTPPRIPNQVEEIASFNTLSFNIVLGIQVEDASIYGSKAEISFADYSHSLAKTIKKNDVITIHALKASEFSTFITTISNSPLVGDVFNDILQAKINQLLEKKQPMFSGLITKPRLISKHSTQLRIDAQGIVRILQHINTEFVTSSQGNIPTNIDKYFREPFAPKNDDEEDNEKEGSEFIKNDTISTMSEIMNTLRKALINDIGINPNNEEGANPFNIDGRGDIIYFDSIINANFQEIKRQLNSTDNIRKNVVIIQISAQAYMFLVNPIYAAKIFLEYYTKAIGMFSYFETEIFDDNSSDESLKEQAQKLNKMFIEINKQSETRIMYFSFVLTTSTDSFLHPEARQFVDKIRIFSKSSVGNFKFQTVDEFAVLEYITKENNSTNTAIDRDVMVDLFMRILGVDLDRATTQDQENAVNTSFDPIAATLINGTETHNIFYTITVDEIVIPRINNNVKNIYLEKKGAMDEIFDVTIDITEILHSKIFNLRSTKFNPFQGDEKSIPITQVIQMFIASINLIPMSQSASIKAGGNAAYDMSQRIWLSADFAFKKDDSISYTFVRTSPDQKINPMVVFSLNYAEAVPESEENNIPRLQLHNMLEFEIFDLPHDGTISTYAMDNSTLLTTFFTDQSIEKNSFSIGSLQTFNASDIFSDSILIDQFVKENVRKQESVTSEASMNIPRVGAVRFGKTDFLPEFAGNAWKDADGNTVDSFDNDRIYYLYYDFFIGAYNLISTSDVSQAGRTTTNFDNTDNSLQLYLYPVETDSAGIKRVRPQKITDVFTTSGSAGIRSILDSKFDGSVGSLFNTDKPHNIVMNNTAWKNADVFNKEGLIIGIQTYYDIRAFLPIFESIQNQMDVGLIGINGSGNKDWYKEKLFMFTNHVMRNDEEGFEFELSQSSFIQQKNNTKSILVYDYVLNIIDWLNTFEEDDGKAAMVRFAKDVTILDMTQISDGSKGFVFKPAGLNDLATTYEKINYDGLFGAIKFHSLTVASDNHNAARRTIRILSTFVYGLYHYMSKIVATDTVGGSLYTPFLIKSTGVSAPFGGSTRSVDDSLLHIGDAIIFTRRDQVEDDSSVIGNIVGTPKKIASKIKKTGSQIKSALFEKEEFQSELDILKKVFYIWKRVIYIGGAGDTPSGSSGSTMKLYITDSGLNWQTSYEEEDITSKIAQSIKLRGIHKNLGE